MKHKIDRYDRKINIINVVLTTKTLDVTDIIIIIHSFNNIVLDP